MIRSTLSSFHRSQHYDEAEEVLQRAVELSADDYELPRSHLEQLRKQRRS